jgi:hypothetical protein
MGIFDTLFGKNKNSYGKENDEFLLDELATIRSKEIDRKVRDNEPEVQEIMEARSRKEEGDLIKNQQKEIDELERKRKDDELKLQAEEKKRKIDEENAQEEVLRKESERARNNEAILAHIKEFESVIISPPAEGDNLFDSYDNGAGILLLKPNNGGYSPVASVGVIDNIKYWNIFKIGDKKISYWGLERSATMYQTEKAKNEWSTDYTNADGQLKEELLKKWGNMSARLYAELKSKIEAVSRLIEKPIKDAIEENLLEIEAEYELKKKLGSSSSRWENDETKEEKILSCIEKDLHYFEGIISNSNTPRELLSSLEEVVKWLKNKKEESENKIKIENNVKLENFRREQEQERIEKIKERKHDFILEQIGSKTTYLKELYELESGYDLGYLSGHGTRGSGTGSVMSGAGVGVGVGAGIKVSHSLVLEGVRDGIYLEMGDSLEDAQKRLGMEDFVAPHEIGHLMVNELNNLDKKVLVKFQKDIESICFSMDEDNRLEYEHNIGHHLKECVVDAVGVKMALDYGVSDPFIQNRNERLQSFLKGMISTSQVVLDLTQGNKLKDEEKRGYEFFFLRLIANIDHFIRLIDQMDFDNKGEVISKLEEMRIKSSYESRRLNDYMNEEQRGQIIGLYSEALKIPHQASLNDLEKYE